MHPYGLGVGGGWWICVAIFIKDSFHEKVKISMFEKKKGFVEVSILVPSQLVCPFLT